MKERAFVVAGMLAALALVVFGASELQETRAEVIDHEFPACEGACLTQLVADLDVCNAGGPGRERSACRKQASRDARACLDACQGT